MSDLADKIVEVIFEDIRDRRFLKWLFSKRPTLIGSLNGEDLRSLDEDVQEEIRAEWAKIIRNALVIDGSSIPSQITEETKNGSN